MENLASMTVVITGASSGMGLAAAHAFARRGANVVLAARRVRPRRSVRIGAAHALAGPYEIAQPQPRLRRIA